MAQTLTDRVKAILNTPDTGEQVQIAELNSNFSKLDNNFMPAAGFRSTVDQSIPNNAATKITYPTVAFDSYAARSEGPMADLALDEITIRKAGLYTIKLAGSFEPVLAGARRLDIVKNGVAQVSDTSAGYTGANCCLSIAKDMVLAVNDVISGRAFQNSGAALNWNHNTFAEGNYLSVSWLGSVVEV